MTTQETTQEITLEFLLDKYISKYNYEDYIKMSNEDKRY